MRLGGGGVAAIVFVWYALSSEKLCVDVEEAGTASGSAQRSSLLGVNNVNGALYRSKIASWNHSRLWVESKVSNKQCFGYTVKEGAR